MLYFLGFHFSVAVWLGMIALAGLVPILWSHGSKSDLMKRIAAPMVGGVVKSVLLELAVYPGLYLLFLKRRMS